MKLWPNYLPFSSCRLSDNIEQRNTSYIDFVIIGCESLAGGKAGRFQDGFIEAAIDIVRQCKEAGVKCHVKQIPINGRVSHDIEEWPKELQVREGIICTQKNVRYV
jgi:hypothetical protein